ncbi:MAG: TnpV protein [Defluviitaleaceae bacterium]|nr:TnpV protein [Defluviitaleaceae bacterium]
MKYNCTNRANNIIYLDHHRNRKNPLGRYAKLHQSFLQTHHPNFYNSLLALSKLDEWLHTIDEIANNRFEKGKRFGYSQAEIENTLFTEVIYNLR